MRFALLVMLAAGCSSPLDSSPDAAQSAGETAVERGMQWVAAKVPYCQAPNHQPDGDSSCSATCERPDNPAWDAYRSDCSGFVSWAWGLPPPGRTTATLAPFDTSVSIAIDADQLQPGDAINNSDHTMLFVGWTDGAMTGAKFPAGGSRGNGEFIEEPGCSAAQPYAREVTVTLALDGQSVTVDGYGAFTAIRQR